MSIDSSVHLHMDPEILLDFAQQTTTCAFQLNSVLTGVVSGEYARRNWIFAATIDGDEITAGACLNRTDGYCLLHAVDAPDADRLLTALASEHVVNALAGEADVIGPLTEHPLIASRVMRTEHERFMVMRAFQHQIEPDGNYRLAVPQDIPTLRAYAAGYSAEHNVPFDCDWHHEVARGQVLVAETIAPDPAGHIAACLMRGGMTDLFALCSGVFTFPRFRNKGYATRLVANFAFEAALAGLDTCLYVGVTNRPAIAAYRRAGFFQIGDYLIVYLRRSLW